MGSSMESVGGVLSWVTCQLGWLGLRGRQYRGRRMISQTPYFSPLAGNTYCSKLEKKTRFQVIYTLNIFHFFEFTFEFTVFGYLNLKLF